MPEEMPKEIISYKKLADENIKELEEIKKDAIPAELQEKIEKFARALKAIFAGGIAASSPFLLTACLKACAKEVPVVEEVEETEEEKAEEIVVPEETVEETPPAVEETPEEIEWEGVKITPIEGLIFDKGTFYAEAGNPYNLEAGEKAGVFVKDAVEINGVMESSIGLRPEVIEVMQKEIIEKDKEFRYPLPFNLEEAKGIKIKESEDESLRWLESVEKWALPKILLLSDIPINTPIYAPANSDRLIITKDTGNSRWLFTFSDLVDTKTNSLDFNGKRVDSVDIGFQVETGISLIPSDMEKKFDSNNKRLEIQIKLGQPFIKVSQKGFIPILQFDEKTNNPFFNSDTYSMAICLSMSQLDEQNKYNAIGFLQTGEKNLLFLDQYPVSLMTANGD